MIDRPLFHDPDGSGVAEVDELGIVIIEALEPATVAPSFSFKQLAHRPIRMIGRREHPACPGPAYGSSQQRSADTGSPMRGVDHQQLDEVTAKEAPRCAGDITNHAQICGEDQTVTPIDR